MPRLLTALILIPLVFWGIFSSSPSLFAGIVAAILLFGGWEWCQMAGLSPAARILPLFALSALFYLSHLSSPMWILLVALGGWMVAAVWVVRYPAYSHYWQAALWVRLTAGMFLLVPTYVALLWIRQEGQGAWDLVYLMLLIWGADSAAYFAGRQFGKHKLAPQLSPGKTWEGFMGAHLAGLLLAIWGWAHFNVPVLFALLMSIGVVTISVLGDLFESLCKREAGVKDSGQILPGHGGVMDRIDSLTAAAPLFAVLWMCQL